MAPAAFLGNLTAFDGGVLNFDATLLAFNGPGSAVFGGIRIFSGANSFTADVIAGIPPLGSWATFSTPLTAANFGLAQAAWDAVLMNVTNIRITVESINGTETFGFDNPTLLMAAPEPTTLALMGLALAGLGFQRRKAA